MSGNQRVRVNLGPAEVDVDGYRRDGRSLTLRYDVDVSGRAWEAQMRRTPTSDARRRPVPGGRVRGRGRGVHPCRVVQQPGFAGGDRAASPERVGRRRPDGRVRPFAAGQRGLDPNRPWLWWKDFDGSVHVVQPAGHFIHEPEPEPVGAPDA